MKCEQFFFFLESSSFWRRWLARRHAQHCSRCTQALATFLRFKQEFSRPESLTAGQRQLWRQAAAEAAPEPSRRSQHWQIAFAAACVLLIGFFTVVYYTKFQGQRHVVEPKQPAADQPVIAASIDPLPPLRDLETQLDELENQLAILSKQAELIDARNQALTMIDTYKRW